MILDAKKYQIDRGDIGISIIMSLVVTLQRLIKFSGDIYQKLLPDTFRNFRLSDLLVFCIVVIFCYFLIFLIRMLCRTIQFFNKDMPCELSRKRKIILWLLLSAAIAVWSFLYLSMSYPGSVLEDSMSSLEQSMGYMNYSNHHPIAFTLFVQTFLKLGLKVRDNMAFAVFVVSCAQICIISGIQGYFLLWLNSKNVKKVFIVLVYLFYIWNALLPTYSFTMWKDPLFSAFLFAYILHLYDIFASKGKILHNKFFVVRYFALLILVAFFRNNAIYVALFTSLILILYFGKTKFPFSAMGILLVALCIVVQNPVYHHFGLKTLAQEKIGIPMQQVAYVLATDGKMKEENILNRLLPIPEWKESYTPFIADSIKWNPQFDKEYINSDLSGFLRVWAINLPTHFGDYVKAYMMETYGFWSVETQDDYCYCQNEITENLFDLSQRDLLHKFLGVDLSFLKSRTGRFCNGTLFWIMILTMYLQARSSEKEKMLSLIPLLLTWGTFMVATPVAFSLRYMLAYVYALPFLIYMIWDACQSEKGEKDRENLQERRITLLKRKKEDE